MTGFEMLKEEMKKRGCSPQQIESKTTRVVLDILAKTGTTFTDAYMVEKEAQEIRDSAREYEKSLNRYKEGLQQREKKFQEQRENLEKYIDAFYEALGKCETEEGRDAMRRAQVFVNTVNIETPQNNTAFIDGLARILSLGETSSLLKFEKVTKPDE